MAYFAYFSFLVFRDWSRLRVVLVEAFEVQPVTALLTEVRGFGFVRWRARGAVPHAQFAVGPLPLKLTHFVIRRESLGRQVLILVAPGREIMCLRAPSARTRTLRLLGLEEPSHYMIHELLPPLRFP